MRKKVSQLLKVNDSVYITVGDTLIRVSNHLPKPGHILSGGKTKHCKNIYFMFVKSRINKTLKSGVALAKLIQLKESNNRYENIQGEVRLNNLVARIGNDTNKGTNYGIVNTPNEADAAVEEVKRMLKTTVFVPLKYIIIAEDL